MRYTFYNQFSADRKKYGIEYAAKHAKALGFDSVEYVGSLPTGVAAVAAEERAVLDRYGLSVACYSVGVQLFAPDQAEVERKMFEEIEAAAVLGTKFIHHTLCPPCSAGKIRNTYDVLLTGVTLVTRAFTGLLRANGGGSIITVSSVGGAMTLPLTPTYHAAKYAVEGLMEGLSYELAPFGIDCKIIEPGGVQTDFWGRSNTVVDVADTPYEAEAGRYLEGMTQPVSDNRATPGLVADKIYEAATDGKHTWRYPVACEEFLAWRHTMTDEEWYELQVRQYLGKDEQ